MLPLNLPTVAVFFAAFINTASSSAPLIDRRSVVSRHNVPLGLPIDPKGVTPLGNGAFAFNVDITGLQSLNASYPYFDLNTLADWAWHTSYTGSEALSTYNFTTYTTATSAGGNRTVRYPTGSNATASTGQWLHNNPHKLPLAQVSLAWLEEGGDTAPLSASDLRSAAQVLDAWTGEVTSTLTLQGEKPGRNATDVRVWSTVHPDVDALAVRVEATTGTSPPPPLALRIAFPYTLGGGPDWSPSHNGLHTTVLVVHSAGRFTVERTLDGDYYTVDCACNSSWSVSVSPSSPHVLVLLPPQGPAAAAAAAGAATDLFCLFAPPLAAFPIGASTPWLQQKRALTLALQQSPTLPGYQEAANASAVAWAGYWGAGAFLDLASGGPAPDALELERRVVRSLYLLRALEAGAEPPAETGLLLAGGWAGKHHGEMRFWHQAWAAFWGRAEVLSRSDAFYSDYLLNATSVASAQGYEGARWPKMISSVGNRSSANPMDVPWVGLDFAPLPSAVHGGSVVGLAPLLAWESSSGVGPLLVWQQSHSIMLAEAQRRAAAAAAAAGGGGGAAAAAGRATMDRLAPVVFATADFLASFAVPDGQGVYHLLPPLYGGEESGDPLAIRDPAFELVQVNAALDTAAAWRVAMGLPPIGAWDEVRGHLAHPPLDPATTGLPSPPLYANNAACACLYIPGHQPCPFPRPGCPGPLGSHPMTAGLVGMLHGLGGDGGVRYGVDVASANATSGAILGNWSWGTPTSSPEVWGWDAPLLALSLARLGWAPESVVAGLMLPFNKNQYDLQGINQGMGTNTAYFPGNGGTLLAVAALVAGFDGGAPGAQLVAGGPGAIASSPVPPLGFPAAWGAVLVEGFNVPLP